MKEEKSTPKYCLDCGREIEEKDGTWYCWECLRKWGNEYRQCMKEVPRWNFIKGYWNLKKRGKLG